MTDLLSAALDFAQHGFSVVPCRNDGTKAPLSTWKSFMVTPATGEQIVSWWLPNGDIPGNDTPDGFGLVCGGASGNLEMLEFEGRAVTEGMVTAWRQVMLDHGLWELSDRVMTGYLEATPSGGLHMLYRVAGPAKGNTKLARRPSTPEELAGKPEQKVQTLIETRGEGGYVVVAPSGGRATPYEGKAWTMVCGGPGAVPTLTSAERDQLLEVTALLDAMPIVEASPTRAPNAPPAADAGERPGDHYNARADWREILEPHGWRCLGRSGQGLAWARPGKTTPGPSASTGQNDADNLYVFSSSTEFATETPYSKFAAYALLEHGGDHGVAAKALREQGYGGERAPRDATALAKAETDDWTTILGYAPGASPEGAQAAPDPRLFGPTSVPAPLPPLTLVPGQTLTRKPAGRTDVGNADLLVASHGHELRYVARRGAWLRWTGTRWRWDHTGEVIELAKQVVTELDTTTDADFAHQVKSLSRRSVEAMVALARSDRAVSVDLDELDAHPYALCTPGGVVDLRTGRLAPARPEDLHTRCTAVTPDAGCPTPRWTKFLHETFGGDAEVIGFVQRLAGYSASGAVTHHVLPFLHGPGGNGKSVLLDVLRRLLGEYAGSAPAKFLMAGQPQHETEIARLSGMRLVICSEINQQDRFDEAKVKLLTGGDGLTARFMNQDHFDFTPTHHLWLMGNHQPRVASGGESFWRRLRLIPFTNVVEHKVEGLDAILASQEGPGILAWIVAGATAALSGKLDEPESVMAATKAYSVEEDALARFIADRIHLGGGSAVKLDTAVFRHAYEEWCRDEGERTVSAQVLGRELRTRFEVEATRSNGKRFYLGMTLLSHDDERERRPDWHK